MGSRRRIAAVAAALAACAAFAAPASARLPGIDVSRFQGTIDWTRVGKTDVRFAFLQASRGSGRDCTVAHLRCGPDEYYDLNYEGAKANGIVVGPYHRAFVGGKGRRTAKLDAKREARVFIQSVGDLRGGDLRPALDLETPFAGLSAKQLQLWTRTWLTRVERAFGAKPIIYTNYSSWSALDHTTEFALAGSPLWVAHWHVRKPSIPALDWAGESWRVWQHASDGHVRGIRGNVDLDWLRGGLDAVSVGASGPQPG